MNNINFTTKLYKYTGQLDEDGIFSLKGIPYAMAPKGALRWKAPQPYAAASEQMECMKFGPSCVQPADENEPGSLDEQSEDCLYLNIWGRNNGKTGKPVMVFIHGGGFIGGGTSDPIYNGRNFVRNSDVIFVTLNYRVNLFGFMDLSEIGGPEFSDSGNAGILDQIAALRWVKENIAYFGGNPDTVTIFGESAGSASVCLLMTIPEAKGLFSRVIAQSGCLNLLKRKSKAREIASSLLSLSGKKTADELMQLDSDELSKLCDKLSEHYGYGAEIIFAPVADGKLIPYNPYRAIEEGCAVDVKLIIGSNADEFRYWSLYYEDLEDIIFDWIKGNNEAANAAAIDLEKVNLEVLKTKYYDLKPDMELTEKAFQFAHDFLFRMPNIRMAELQSMHSDVWMYYFTWASNIDNIGAGHAVELAFVFHNLHRTEYTGEGQPVALANRIQAAWAGFSVDGNPNHADIPQWDKYDTKTRKTMLIGEDWFLASDFGRKERMFFYPYLEKIENRSN